MQPKRTSNPLAPVSLWERLKPMIEKKELPQAMLFVASRHEAIVPFADQLIGAVLCQLPKAPCSNCNICHLIAEGSHPDVCYVQQHEGEKGIKIDQIRHLQQSIYQTPKRGKYRFIVINPADKMNMAALNALLKILEEPPPHTIFILFAEHTHYLPSTVLSRCQKYWFDVVVYNDYWGVGESYAEGSVRRGLLSQKEAISQMLYDLAAGNTSPCAVAADWSNYELEDVLWVLYILTAQLLHHQLVVKAPTIDSLEKLCCFLKPTQLFLQLERINGLTSKLHHNLAVNKTLALEDLLLGYISS